MTWILASDWLTLLILQAALALPALGVACLLPGGADLVRGELLQLTLASHPGKQYWLLIGQL